MYKLCFNYRRKILRRHSRNLRGAISVPKPLTAEFIALIEDGDKIKIDINNRKINLLVDDETLEQRRKCLKPFELKCKSGYLSKYAKNVQDASHGAIV